MIRSFGGRNFRVWYYTIGHTELLIRSPKSHNNLTNIDIMFSAVMYVELPYLLANLEIVETKDEDVQYIKEKFFMSEQMKYVTTKNITVLVSNNFRYFVVALGKKIEENEADYYELPIQLSYKHKVVLSNANLSGASLVNADLCSVELEKTNFSNANLNNAFLMTVVAKNANFKNAKLINAKLIDANFENASFENADLTGAVVMNTNFKGSNLRGAVMLCKKISDANLIDAFFDDNTKWPSGFNPIEKGAKKI